MRMLSAQSSKKPELSNIRENLNCTSEESAAVTEKKIEYNHFRETVFCNKKNLSLKAAKTSIFPVKVRPKKWGPENKTFSDSTFVNSFSNTVNIPENDIITKVNSPIDDIKTPIVDSAQNDNIDVCTTSFVHESLRTFQPSLSFGLVTKYARRLEENDSDWSIAESLKETDECIDIVQIRPEIESKQSSIQPWQATETLVIKPLTLNLKRKILESDTQTKIKIVKLTDDKLSQKGKENLPLITSTPITNISSNPADSDIRFVDSQSKSKNAYNKLSLSTQTFIPKKVPSIKTNRICASTHTDIRTTRKRRNCTIKKEVSTKRNKVESMSVYDARVQSEERSVGNGFVTRGSHNDENLPGLGNHYYHCSQPTIATLCNIGNTCYLNSVVYTLRFAPLFLHNLHHLVEDLSHIHHKIGKRAKSSSLGRNVSGLQMENVRSWSSKDLASLENSSYDAPKSHQQNATEKLHELYQNLHRNELIETTEPFHADTFLHAIQEVSTIFEGNQQQDAHEFLMCVLDSIRETCQQVIKSISECPDLITNGLPEQAEASQPVTIKERERESSIIKTSFFSRRSKRKDDAKPSKGFRINSPLKDNTVNSVSSDQTDGPINSKNSLSSMSTTEDDITTNDKERLSEKIKKLGLDFFTEDFEGITVSTTKCLSCETITEQKETMIDIAVPISGYENMDSSEKSQSFIQNSCITREYFRGENKYRCEQCIGYTEAIRSISYEVLPRLLVIQLSRFSGGMEKINSYLPTPFTLQCFCAKCCEQPENKKLHVYKLYSVITHVGATMSVGHYIAYTCSLDWASDYVNCPKDRKRQSQLNSLNTAVGNNSSSSSTSSTSSTTNVTTSEKNIGLMKKMRFGRSKASSSGDMSKNVKNINGISSKTITNGVEKLSINTTCQSLNCCGIRIKNNLSTSNTNYNNGSCSGNNNNNGLCIDLADEPNQTSSIFNAANSYGDTINYGNGNKTKPLNSQPTWYMCDDDKVKAMSQREFEDLLSPNRKIMVTPYLLFYARSDLQ